MAFPAQLLEQFSPGLVMRGTRALQQSDPQGHSLALGIAAFDAALPDGGLIRGGVVELCVEGPSAGATSLALTACRAAQQEAVQLGAKAPWCAFVDPSSTLYAPGVSQAGVQLERLLVVRPELEAMSRVALRLVESQAFALVVIDTVGTVGQRLQINLGVWPRLVRRLSLAVEGRNDSVLLITSAEAQRPLPLPVAQRLELSCIRENELVLRVAKDKRGRITAPRPVVWTRAARPQSIYPVPIQEFPHGRRTA